MKKILKKVIKASFLYKVLRYFRKVKSLRIEKAKNEKIIKDWEHQGRQIPPPHLYKILTIKYYSLKFRKNILIETGTYLGETIEACAKTFKKLISIELDQKLYERAEQMFSGNPDINIYQGDSGQLLQDILNNINESCLFWLDGHYSEGFTSKGELNTPILAELKTIFNHPVKTHVILIDDARCFTGQDDYPTLETLKTITKEHNPSLIFNVENDIIRIYPNNLKKTV